MQVHASELNNALESGTYNLVGDDSFWLNSAKEKFVGLVGKESLSLHIFDSLDNINDIIGSLMLISFTDEPNIVLVKDCSKLENIKNTNIYTQLKPIFNSDISPNYLILMNAKIGANEKKVINTISCSKLKKNECYSFAEKLFPKGIDRKGLSTLLDYTNCDLARVNNESEKLRCYCEDKKVTNEDVEFLVVEDTDIQIYNFVNNVIIGNNGMALKQLEKLKKRGESSLAMLGMITNQFRRMLHSSLSNKSNAELADIFKVKEVAVKIARENRSFGVVKLKKTLEMLSDYELRFKSGEMSDQMAFDSAICRLLSKEV
jgi:DNA polymerase-3 subunit delta